MWSAEVGGSVHSKNRLVSSRQHRATEVRKLRFHSSSQCTHGCCAPASWAVRVLILLVADDLLASALSLNIFNGRLNRTLMIVGKK